MSALSACGRETEQPYCAGPELSPFGLSFFGKSKSCRFFLKAKVREVSAYFGTKGTPTGRTTHKLTGKFSDNYTQRFASA